MTDMKNMISYQKHASTVEIAEDMITGLIEETPGETGRGVIIIYIGEDSANTFGCHLGAAFDAPLDKETRLELLYQAAKEILAYRQEKMSD